MIDQIARQNRWWVDPAAISTDRHLVRLASSPLQWKPGLPFRFEHDAIYTLRGPRQVGKSTVLKRQVEALLSAGWSARKILYLDVELAGIEHGRDLVAAIRSYLDAERPLLKPNDERMALLLDEVTRAANWAGALRGLVDNDELRNVTLIATGSHTRDLRQGGERLPGRRGGGSELDLELLPLGFREYVELVEPTLPLPAVVEGLNRDEVSAGSRERAAVRPRLVAVFQRYLATGGFLTAINDEAGIGGVRAETYQLYREAIIGEFVRAGLRESYLRQVVNWLAAHLGQEFDARGIAADTDIGSKDTAQNYVQHLVATYVAGVFYRTPSLQRLSPAFRAPKKIHAVDPLFWHLVRAWAASDPDPWSATITSLAHPDDVGHLVESVMALHLRRAYGDRVYYWRPDAQREIDFVWEPRQGEALLAEVKYQPKVDDADARTLARAGGGLIASRSWEGRLANGVYVLPAAELLSLLDAPALGPTRLS